MRNSKDQLDPTQKALDAIESSLTTGMVNAFDGIIQGTMSVKEAFLSMAQGILQALSRVIAELIAIQILKSIISGFSSPMNDPSIGMTDYSGGFNVGNQRVARYGGVFSNGKKVSGYSMGGIAKGSQAGYPAILHGTEAVVPLPNGNSIPVDLKGAGQQNNVTVNVAVDSKGNASQDTQADSNQGKDLGKSIAAAVQKELMNQKRQGGILNPYGVA